MMDQGSGPENYGNDAGDLTTYRPMPLVYAGGTKTILISQSSGSFIQLCESSSGTEAVRRLSETRPVFKIGGLMDNRDGRKATSRRLVALIVESPQTGDDTCGDHLQMSNVSPHRNVVVSLFRSMQQLPGWMQTAIQEIDVRKMAGTTDTQDYLKSIRSGAAACCVTGVEPFECSLTDWMRDKLPDMPYFLAADALLQIALDIAKGMHHLQRHGVVHRDLKLDNVMWDSKGGPEGVGRAVLMDFLPGMHSIEPNDPVSPVDAADRDLQTPEAGPASGAGAAIGPSGVTNARPRGHHAAGADLAVEAVDRLSAEHTAGAGAGAGHEGRPRPGRQAALALGRVLQELLAESMQLNPEIRRAAEYANACGQSGAADAGDASATGQSYKTGEEGGEGPQDVPPGTPAELQCIATTLEGLLSPDPHSRMDITGAIERLRMVPTQMYYGMNHLLSGLVWEDGSSSSSSSSRGAYTELFDEVREDVEASSRLEGVHVLLRLANGLEILRWAHSWDDDPRFDATDEEEDDPRGLAQRESRQALIKAVGRATSRDARHLKSMLLEGNHGPLVASLRNAMHGKSMLMKGGEACDVISDLTALFKGEMMCNLVVSEGLIQCVVELLASSRCSDRKRAASLVADFGTVLFKQEEIVVACVQANALPWLGGMLEHGELIHGGEATLAAKALLAIVQQVDIGGKRQVVQAGCLRGLARALSRPGTPAFTESANVVRRIANESQDLRRAVVQQDGMLIGVMDGFGRADHDSAAEYIETLIALGTGDDEAMLSLLDAGGIDVVARAMRSGAGCVESTALRALSTLIDCDSSPLRHTLHRHVLQTDMLPSLALSLTSQRGIDSFWATKSLLHLAKGNDEAKRRIVASGALPGIVWIMQAGKLEESEMAIRVLQHVPCTTDEWKELADQTDVMPELVRLLEFNSHGVARQAAKVLVRLSGKTLGLLDMVRGADPFPSLVPLLTKPGSKDAHVAIQALHAVLEDVQSLNKLREIKDIVPSLVALLGDRATPPEDIARGVKVFVGIMSARNDIVRSRLQDEALRAGVLGAARGLLSQRRESHLTVAALGLISSVQGKWSAAIQTLDQRGAEVIVAYLDSNDRAVRFAAASTLTRILADTYEESNRPDCRGQVLASILGAGAVPVTIRMLQRYFDDKDVRSSFSQLLLLVLDRSTDGMAAVVSGGGVPLLVQQLSLYPQDSQAAAYAAIAVTQLLSGPQWAVDAVLEEGPFQALIKMIQPGDDATGELDPAAKAAVEALTSAARIGDHLKRAITELGSVPFLARILGHGKFDFRDAAIDCLLELSSGPEPVQVAVADAKVLDDLARVIMPPITTYGTRERVIIQLARNLVSRSTAVRHAVSQSKLFGVLVTLLQDSSMEGSRHLLQQTVAILTRDPAAMRQLDGIVSPPSWGTILSQLQENVDAGSHRARELRDRLRSFGWHQVNEEGGDGDLG